MATDNLGRDAGDLPVNALVQGLSSNVTEVMESNDTQSGQKLDSLLRATKGVADAVGDNIGESIRAAQTYAQQTIQTHQKLFVKESRQESRQQKEQVASARNTTDLIRKIYNMGKTPRTFWVGVGTIHANALHSLKKVLSDCGLCRGGSRAAEAIQKAQMNRQQGAAGGVGGLGGRGGMGGGGGSGGSGGFGEMMEDASGGFMSSANMLTGAATLLAAATSRLAAVFEVDFSKVVAGLATEGNALRMQIREYLFITEGMTKSNRELAKSFMMSGADANAMGVFKGTADKLFMQNLQRGLVMETALGEAGLTYNKVMEKRLQATKMTMKIGVHAAKQLGMSVDSMNQMFMDWRMNLGLGVHELARMGTAMEAVAASTGVTGSQLEQAVKSSEQIMQKMKQAGTLSATSAKSVLSMMTAAQQFGVSDEMGELMTALTGGGNAFDNADATLQNFLLGAAARTGDQRLTERTRFGDVTDPEDLAKLSGSMTEYVKELTGITDQEVQALGFEKFDMTNLGAILQEMKDTPGMAERAFSLEGMILNLTGKEAGTLSQMFKSMEAGNKANETYQQRIKTITEQMKEMEKANLQGTKAYQDLQNKLVDVDTQKFKDGFNEYINILKERGNVGADVIKEELIEELSKTMGPDAAKNFANNLAGGATDFLDNLGKRAEMADRDLGKMLEAQGVTQEQLTDMLSSDNVELSEQAMNIMNDVAMEIETDLKAAQDPVTKWQNGIRKFNAWLRDKVDWFFGIVPDRLLDIAILLGQAGPIFGLLALMFGALKIFKGGLGALIPGSGMMGGRAMLGLGGGASRAASVTAATQPFVGMSGAMGAQAQATRAAATKAGGGLFGKLLGPLSLAIGGLTGALEAEENKRSTTAGFALGALTGDASTGSMFSKSLGIEQGSTADKTLGIAGGTAWGAAAGAAIGSAFFGVGAAPGAAIGAAIGAVTEMVKIITDGTNTLNDIFGPVQVIVDYVWGVLKNVWKLVKGIFTLDFGMVADALLDTFVSTIALIPSLIWSSLKAIVIGLPKLFMQAFKAVFLDLPKLLMDGIKSGLASLAKSEWVGPIFETLSEAFNELYDGWMAIYTPLSEAFGHVFGIFNEIGEAIFGVSAEGGAFTMIMGGLKYAIKGLATVIGWALKPVVWLAKAVGWLMKQFGALVEGIVAPFKWLYDVLVGHSIVPDLVHAIIKFFAMLPINIMKGLWNLMKKLPEILWEGMKMLGNLALKLPGLIWNGLKGIGGLALKLPGMIWEGLKGIGGLAMQLPGLIWNGLKGVGKLALKLPGMIWEGIKGIGGWLWDALTGGLASIGSWIGGAVKAGIDAVKEVGKEVISDVADSEGVVGAAATVTGVKTVATLADANIEVNEMGERMEKFANAQQKFDSKSLADTKAISNAKERLAELERKKNVKEMGLGGMQRNLRRDQKERAGVTNWFGVNPHARALNKSIANGKRMIADRENAIAALDAEIAKAKSEIKTMEASAVEVTKAGTSGGEGLQEEATQSLGNIDTNMDVTSRTMAMGQNPGSIYVHDVHLEAIMHKMLKVIGGEDNKIFEQMYESLTDHALKTAENFIISHELKEGILIESIMSNMLSIQTIKTLFLLKKELEDIFEVSNLTSKTQIAQLDGLFVATNVLWDLKGLEISQVNYLEKILNVMTACCTSTTKYLALIEKRLFDLYMIKMTEMAMKIGGAIGGPLGELAGLGVAFGSSVIGSMNSADRLESSLESIKNARGGIDPANEGAFSAEAPQAALESGLNSNQQQILNDLRDAQQQIIKERERTIEMQNSGAFDPEAAQSALGAATGGVTGVIADSGSEEISKENKKIIQEVMSKRLEVAAQAKQLLDKKTTMAEAGKGLYYDLEKPLINDTAAQVQSIIKEQAELAKADAKAGYEANAGSGLDYREQIKGQVSAVASTIAEAERRVAQEKASAESEGNSTAMGMSGVESILHEEVALMQMIHEALIAIKENTSPRTGTNVVGPRGGNPAPRALGVKSIARDYVRGSWDVNHHDMAPANVTSDGKGGY